MLISGIVSEGIPTEGIDFLHHWNKVQKAVLANGDFRDIDREAYDRFRNRGRRT